MTDESESEHWRRYYDVTVDRPAWETVRVAIANFQRDDATQRRERFAVDLGCGAGRDARELLRAGWRVLAIDRETSGLAVLTEKTPAEMRNRLTTKPADLATVEIPRADLVNASLCLPFLPQAAFWSAWRRMLSAVSVGGRVGAMVFGNRDESAGEPGMTFVEPEAFRQTLEPDFQVEHWVDLEEDTKLALGDPHHSHRVDVVARRIR